MLPSVSRIALCLPYTDLLEMTMSKSILPVNMFRKPVESHHKVFQLGSLPSRKKPLSTQILYSGTPLASFTFLPQKTFQSCQRSQCRFSCVLETSSFKTQRSTFLQATPACPVEKEQSIKRTQRALMLLQMVMAMLQTVTVIQMVMVMPMEMVTLVRVRM
jgi:hypothetical protein